MTESEKALAIHHLSRMVKAGRYLDSGAHISLPVLHSLGIALNALKERRTGKWIHQYKEIPNMATFKCSCCGCVDEFAAKYCSNCGAKMEVNE